MKTRMLNLICASVSLIALVLMFTSQINAKVDPETLVGAWFFDGDAKDASGNGKDGTLENGPKWAAGKFGQALEFNGGKKSYVNVGNLDLKGPVTLVFWAKPAGLEERIVVQNALPALKNHLVYVAYETSVQGRIRSLIQMVEEEATQTGTVFDENGLRIRRCIY